MFNYTIKNVFVYMYKSVHAFGSRNSPEHEDRSLKFWQ